ncbi:unnamed protein product [Anisakis simplex]|uniref:Ig-like domain-containing protein n=1 Tax=Anisakis simplex TaxID=6269 RepID=A0A3P6PGT5_ANISI|nr:unnamed protein product [Anisakis simplex]
MTCPAEHAPGVSGTAEWEKVGGDLPYAYSIRNGELILKDLSRYDEGIYRCTIRAESGMATVTYINLQVSGMSCNQLLDNGALNSFQILFRHSMDLDS